MDDDLLVELEAGLSWQFEHAADVPSVLLRADNRSQPTSNYVHTLHHRGPDRTCRGRGLGPDHGPEHGPARPSNGNVRGHEQAPGHERDSYVL